MIIEEANLPGFITDITNRFDNNVLYIPKSECGEVLDIIKKVASDQKIYTRAKEKPGYTILNAYKNIAGNVLRSAKNKNHISLKGIVRFGSLWQVYEEIVESNESFKSKYILAVSKNMKIVAGTLEARAFSSGNKDISDIAKDVSFIADKIGCKHYFWHEHFDHIISIAGLSNGNKHRIPTFVIKNLKYLRDEAKIDIPNKAYCSSPL